jgi:hypothetical protein
MGFNLNTQFFNCRLSSFSIISLTGLLMFYLFFFNNNWHSTQHRFRKLYVRSSCVVKWALYRGNLTWFTLFLIWILNWSIISKIILLWFLWWLVVVQIDQIKFFSNCGSLRRPNLQILRTKYKFFDNRLCGEVIEVICNVSIVNYSSWWLKRFRLWLLTEVEFTTTRLCTTSFWRCKYLARFRCVRQITSEDHWLSLWCKSLSNVFEHILVFNNICCLDYSLYLTCSFS